MVGALGVVEHQSVGEFLVEEGEVSEEQIFGIVEEGFRESAMEALGRSIHFRGLRVGRPTGDPLFREDLGEAGLELGAVVRQEHLRRLGQERQGDFEGGPGMAGDFAGDGDDQGEGAGGVDEGDEVAADAVKHLKSTNMLERLNEEIKRRTRVVRIFPNTESCLRLVRALCVEIHEAWLEGNRYLNMELLAEHRRGRLPATAS
jgi:hypothetical protein